MAATQWCFATNELLYDQPFAGQPALMGFFPHEFAGALVNVLWAPYNAGLRFATKVSGASVARPRARETLQIARRALAGLCQETAPPDQGRDSAVAPSAGINR